MVQWENGGPMKILGVQFDYGEKTDYARLASVFEKSVAENCPAAELTILTMDTPRAVKKNKGMTSNYEKFKLWNSFIQDQREGEHVILMDVDMMMLGDMRPAFNEDFDIAITQRTSTSWPYNGGVVFVKVNDRSKAFIAKWGEIDEQMYRDDAFHDPYKKKYKGQNQSSLGWMVKKDPTGSTILELPCAVWNSCNEDWIKLDSELVAIRRGVSKPTTRCVHIKSTLRHYCLGKTTGRPSALRNVCKLWQRFEAAE